MMRTIVMRVNRRAADGEQLRDAPVNLLDGGFREVSASDTGLIGDNDDPQTRSVERPDGVYRPGKERHALGPIEIADLLDNGPISIEKDGSTHLLDLVALTTASTEMSRMQRWVNGHSRSMQGRHQT